MQFNYPTEICFVCSKCGLCCGNTTKKIRRVLLLKSDIERIATSIKEQVSFFADQISKRDPYIYEMHKTGEGKCVFLQNSQCTIYKQRPLICRFYPFELSTDENGVHSFGFTFECPGVCRPSTGVGKNKLDKRFFDNLLELAFVELKSCAVR